MAMLGAPLAWSESMKVSSGSQLTIDGLSIAFSVMRGEKIEKKTLEAIRASNLTAINMTTPSPGGTISSSRR